MAQILFRESAVLECIQFIPVSSCANVQCIQLWAGVPNVHNAAELLTRLLQQRVIVECAQEHCKFIVCEQTDYLHKQL